MPLFGSPPPSLPPHDALALRRIEQKLDLLLSHLGIKFESADDGLEEVRTLIAQNKKIEAIKRYREITGASLFDAKQAIDGGV